MGARRKPVQVHEVRMTSLVQNLSGETKSELFSDQYMARDRVDGIDSGIRWVKRMAETIKEFYPSVIKDIASVRISPFKIGRVDDDGRTHQGSKVPMFEWTYHDFTPLDERVESVKAELRGHGKQKKKRGRKRLLDTPGEIEDVCRLYYIRKLSMLKVGQMMGASEGVVKRVLDENGDAYAACHAKNDED